jgi:hypothetical protein
MTQEKKTSRLAIAALVLPLIGLIGPLFCLSTITFDYLPQWFVISRIGYATSYHVLSLATIVALVCGIKAIRKIRRSPNLKGIGLAIAGLVVAGLILIPSLMFSLGTMLVSEE